MKARTCWASRRSRSRYKNSPKLLKKRVIVANCARARGLTRNHAFPMMKTSRWSYILDRPGSPYHKVPNDQRRTSGDRLTTDFYAHRIPRLLFRNQRRHVPGRAAGRRGAREALRGDSCSFKYRSPAGTLSGKSKRDFGYEARRLRTRRKRVAARGFLDAAQSFRGT